MREIWRPVPGWCGLYEVSSGGRVRSVDRRCAVTNRFGKVELRLHRGKLLKPGRTKGGYFVVVLTRTGVRSCQYVHRLVALAFFGPAPSGHEVCHVNGNRSDCRLLNLRYGTRSSNAMDRHEHGTMNQARGEAHPWHKLSDATVRQIRNTRGAVTLQAWADELGVTLGTVFLARSGKSWAHVD